MKQCCSEKENERALFGVRSMKQIPRNLISIQQAIPQLNRGKPIEQAGHSN
jgi:hypothetical protein